MRRMEHGMLFERNAVCSVRCCVKEVNFVPLLLLRLVVVVVVEVGIKVVVIIAV